MRALVRRPFLKRLTREPDRPGTSGSDLLREQVAALTGNCPADAKRLEVQAWAIVHGLAMLMLDGLLPIDDRLIDEVVDVQTLFGLKIGSAN